MNLEDGSGDSARPLIDFQLAVEKIRAARQAAMQLRAQFVINARTDVYLLPGSNPDTDYSEAVRRLVAFRDAGADCVFAPGLKDAETIGRLVKVVECPLNILAGPGTPSIPELEKLGVARVSVGSGPDACDARPAATTSGGTQGFRNVQRDGGSCTLRRSEQTAWRVSPEGCRVQQGSRRDSRPRLSSGAKLRSSAGPKSVP